MRHVAEQSKFLKAHTLHIFLSCDHVTKLQKQPFHLEFNEDNYGIHIHSINQSNDYVYDYKLSLNTNLKFLGKICVSHKNGI